MTQDLKDVVVSEGTLSLNDLIPRFADFLESQKPHWAGSNLVAREYEALIKRCREVDLQHTDLSDGGQVYEVVDLYEALTDALDAIAPDGYYFGPHEGDGACIGFWEA